MRKLLIFILAMAAYGAWDQYHKAQPVAAVVGAHDEVIMYSLTTCGYCKQKKDRKRGQIYLGQDI